MKRTLLIILCLSFLIGAVYAEDFMQPTRQKTIAIPQQGVTIPKTRTAPEFTFTKTPTSLLTSYYDYMIGSYNGLPLQVIPESAGGGYFLTYHATTSGTATRRVYYAYLSQTGDVISNSTITLDDNREGYPTIAVDPISGKPMYAWHADADGAENPAILEVQFVSDAFLEGIEGLWNELDIAVDNPITVAIPSGVATDDNEFIWPTAQIGPSNVEGKRRVYVSARNSVTHNLQTPSAVPVENPYIAYADFSADDIENGVPLDWSYTTIPEMDVWNSAILEARRPNHVLVCDDAGSIYYIGYHSTWGEDGNSVDEDDFDAFKLDNYGEGEWTRVIGTSSIPTWNPPDSLDSVNGYFTDSDNQDVPWTDDQLSWSIVNSSHLNATIDNSGKIHVPALWGYTVNTGTYYPAMQFMKEMVFDTVNNSFNIKEVYPQKDPMDSFNQAFTPWDMDAPFGVVDTFYVDNTNAQFPGIATDWNFPHWDQESHVSDGSPSMMFHISNMKVTKTNAEGMMAVVWQNSYRAKMINQYADPDYADYGNTPEIFISVSADEGEHWSEPLVINNQETPEFAGLKPMYVYPADKIIFTGMQGKNKVGKIGLMFYDDNTWGATAIAPNEFTNDGGRVMFTEIQVVFPIPGANSDMTVTPVTRMLNQNYPNPFNPETTISFDMPKTANANVSVYNVKGQLVKTLLSGKAEFGRNNLVWNGKDNKGASVSSGLYFYRLSTDGKTETRKMMLMK
ncbi:MAG: T9SS type A sorting domain-containing protein [Candidatus Cloacimonetes bacterium]|nr:T9SS type A sorting domain-containing protein [Candidatus Cloacimonadota bacterium]